MTAPRTHTRAASAGKVEPIAVDAARIVDQVFPDISLRTWRRMDSAGQCPSGFTVGGRKLWRLADLEQWASFGFPPLAEFEARKQAADNGRRRASG